MPVFSHSLARIAVWNLAGFNPVHHAGGIDPDSDKARNQAEGLALLDAELVTLVEVSPLSHIHRLADLLREDYGLDYDATIMEQPNGHIHIGFLHKQGVELDNLQFVAGSEGDYGTGAHIAQLRETPGLTQRTILLMGDFNMVPGQDVSDFHHLGGDDVMDFV